MQNQDGRNRRSILFACLLLCLSCLLPLKSQAAETVKVGYDATGALTYKDEQGVFRGYNVDFLYEIAKYTRWQYEFVPYNTWAGALQAVEAGEIDLLPTVLRTPERDRTLLFANHWMGMIHVALVVPKDDKVHFYGDLPSLEGLRIGVRLNTKDAEDVQKWAASVGLHYKLSIYGDNKQLLEALDAGQIDAAGLSYVGLATKYRAIVEFAPQEMYFAIAPNRLDIKTRMDAALGQIGVLNPDFFSNTITGLTGRDKNPLPVFSLREQAYIDANKPVRVTFLRNAPPFSFQDGNGKFRGLLPELLERITQLSKLHFTYVPVNSAEEALEFINHGKADMVGSLVNNLVYANRNELRLTSPYVYLSMVQLSNREAKSLKRIGVQDASQLGMARTYNKLDSSKEYTVFANVAESFDALTEGRVDALYCDSATASYFMETHRASQYQMVLLAPYNFDYTFGLCDKLDSRLAVIMDKCLLCISSKEVEEMLYQNRRESSMSITGILERLPGTYLFGLFVALSAGLLAFAWASLSLWRNRGIEQRMQAVRDKNRQMAMDLALAQKVNATKGELFTNVGQEMYRPVEEIMEYLTKADRAQDSEDQTACVAKALAAGRQLEAGLADMLSFTQLAYGKPQLQLETVASDELVQAWVEPYRVLAGQKGLNFIVDTKELASNKIRVDRQLTGKIFAKVLDNAFNFTPAGGSVKFSAESLLSAKGRYGLWVKVIDTGIGISKDFMPDVYEPFAREVRPEVAAVTGRGLGLTIVRLLLNLLGGEIELKSKCGEGTEVRLELYFDLAE